MPYFSGQRNPGVKAKVLSAIPSVELRDGELMGCTTVQLKEPLDKAEMSVLQEYLLGQFSDGWGEGFEQREIQTADGVLYVHFWEAEPFSFEVVPVQTAEPAKEPPVPKRPKMKLAGMDGKSSPSLAGPPACCGKTGSRSRLRRWRIGSTNRGITTRRSPLSASMWKPNCRSNRLRDPRRNGVTPDE